VFYIQRAAFPFSSKTLIVGEPKDHFSYSDVDYFVDSRQGDSVNLKSAPSTFNTTIGPVTLGVLHKSIQDMVEEGSWFYLVNQPRPVV
jgi:hypothetical protein